MTMNMGADTVYTYTKGIRFHDGTVQTTAAGTELFTAPQCGVALFTGGATSAVVFVTPYVANSAPIVVVTGLAGVYTHSLFYSVSLTGTAGAWTGFTLTLSANLFGAFNWVAIGNPD